MCYFPIFSANNPSAKKVEPHIFSLKKTSIELLASLKSISYVGRSFTSGNVFYTGKAERRSRFNVFTDNIRRTDDNAF